MALLGCDVVATDQIEVLPLLRRNVERNSSTIMQMNPGSGVHLFCISPYLCMFLVSVFSWDVLKFFIKLSM